MVSLPGWRGRKRELTVSEGACGFVVEGAGMGGLTCLGREVLMGGLTFLGLEALMGGHIGLGLEALMGGFTCLGLEAGTR